MAISPNRQHPADARPAKPLMRPVRPSTRYLSNSAVPYALVLAIAMIAATWIVTRGQFTYSLDDPYIHLTLARNILHGSYGINPGEFASPSSSILWPFLLAPFADTPFAVWVPLVINVACFVAIVQVLYAFVRRDVSAPAALAIAMMLTIALNLLALMMMGMEHTLQVLLVAVVAIETLKDRPNPLVFYPAVVLLPLVRYEDLAISLPALVYCYWRGMRRGPVVACIAIAAMVGGFSLFMRHLGLDYLPSSVLAKLEVNPHASAFGVVQGIYYTFRANASAMFFNSLMVLFVGLIFFQLHGKAREIAVLLIVPTLLIYTFGKSGWNDRYQIHMLIYCFVMLWELPRQLPFASFHRRFGVPLAVVLVFANFNFVRDAVDSSLASKNIHDQQYQLATLVRDYLKEPVAVNDLGMVAYYGGEPVVDLWGLGSIDALRARIADPSGAWVGEFMNRKGVEFAFVYESWFPKRPVSWVQVGTLTLPDRRVSTAYTTVELFATNAAAAQRLKAAFARYRDASPLAGRIASQP